MEKLFSVLAQRLYLEKLPDVYREINVGNMKSGESELLNYFRKRKNVKFYCDKEKRNK